ncbi:hypothetical protein ACUSIJ_02795 [Pseudochelatococcus sp. B33]
MAGALTDDLLTDDVPLVGDFVVGDLMVGDLIANAGVPLPPASPALAARLAEAIVRPLSAPGREGNPPGFGGLSDGAAAAMRALARHPGFSGPLNRAAARLSGLSDIVFDERALLRIGHSSASDCAVFLATAAPERLEEASLYLGSIVLHRQLLGLALRREREALQRILGEEIYRVATREAPVLHAIFADLDDRSFVVISAALGEEARERRTATGIAAVGQRVLRGFVAKTEPPLAPLMVMRGGGHAAAGGDAPALSAMTDRHLAHIAKLLQRRFGPWPPITG